MISKKKVLLVGIYDKNTITLAPQMLKTYAEQFPISQKFDIQTLDLSIFSQESKEHIDRIKSKNPDIVGFSTYIWSMPSIKKILPNLQTKIVLGGPQCTGVEEELMNEFPNINYVVSGEGIVTFKELLEVFAKEKNITDVRGVSGKNFKNPSREIIKNLDSIPSPYERIFSENKGLEWIAYETSKGCPFGCKYCTWGFSKEMRYYSLQRVIKDLDTILNEKSIKKIYLCDSSILYDKERAKKILGFIRDKNPEVSVRYEFDAVHLDDELISYLVSLKNNEFNFGLQSTNPSALKTMGRRFNKKKFEQNYHKLISNSQNSKITIDLIYGLPGDNYRGYANSLDYVLTFKEVNWILTNPLIILPGSDFYKEREKYGIVLRDKESYIVSENDTFSKEDMARARKLSYLVSTIYLNKDLRLALQPK